VTDAAAPLPRHRRLTRLRRLPIRQGLVVRPGDRLLITVDDMPLEDLQGIRDALVQRLRLSDHDVVIVAGDAIRNIALIPQETQP
jgi:hypothetical protein